MSEATVDSGKKTIAPKDIPEAINLFVNQIDALAETLPLANLAIQNVRGTAGKEFIAFLQNECKVEKKEGDTTTYTFVGGQFLKYQRLTRRTHKANLASILVPRSLFVALVSQFDAHVGELIRQLLKLKPETLSACAKPLTYAQLVEFGSMEKAREYVIEKQIESVLRDSHTDQFDWLQSTFGIKLRTDFPAWPVFIEITERRNLFVHTNGVVSRQYLDVCQMHKCNLAEGLEVGMSLPLTREYFAASFDCILEVGVKLGQVLWRKIQPTESVAADRNLMEIAYSLISEGKYQAARALLEFATCTLQPYLSSESSRLRFVINLAQTYKWAGEEELCKQTIDKEDWSAADARFALACAVLRDDFDGANAIVKKIGKGDSELDAHAYREWPLFKKYRQSLDFPKLFEEIFGEPLNQFVLKDGGETPPETQEPSAPVN